MLNPNFYLFLRSFIKSSSKWSLPIAFALLGSLSLVGQNRFVQVPSYAAGGKLPTLLAQNDVNADGKIDLIVMNINTTTKLETVSLLPGTGTGGYQAPKTMSYYPVSYGVPLAADVNRDGHVDLIFSSASPQVTRVYLGQGEGFQSTAIVSKGSALCALPNTCSSPEMQVADLNKDGNPDLIVHPVGGSVYVSLGNGNGTFRASVLVPTDVGDLSFVVADFNGDSLPDLAVNDGSRVEILPGNGNGTFRQGQIIDAPLAGRLLAADLRGNGKTDLILITSVTSAQSGGECRMGGVAVLLGNGDGTLNPTAAYYSTGPWTLGGLVVDMNGDHRPDLVVANQSSGSYSVLLNAGAGKFSPAVNYRSPENLGGNFVIGDLNGDGRPDLTISSTTGVEVLKNGGAGRLLAPLSLDLGEGVYPSSTYAADLNHDGYPDLVGLAGWDYGPCHTNEPSQQLLVLGNWNGKPLLFYGGLSYKEDSGLGIGDFDRDGNLDILTVGDTYAPESILTIQRTNGLPSLPPFSLDGFSSGVAVGDFNRDGYADVALRGDNGIQILLGDGTGNFNIGENYPGGVGPLLARDISGDGKVDLIDLGADGVHILLGNGNGTFQARKTYPSTAGYSLVIADFNRDGKLDLAQGGGVTISLLLNNGNGTFKPAVNYPSGVQDGDIAAISLMGDGKQSILVSDYKNNKLFLLAGDGKGTFAAPAYYYPGGGNPSGLTVADFNGDGASDVEVADPVTHSFMILYNTGGTSIKLTSSNIKPLAGQTVTFTATLAASIPGTSTPSGTVTFKNGSTTLGTATLSGGKATFSTASLTRGVHTITAVYSGSTTFNSHTSTALTITVQ
jgi:hypothetical protein